MIEGVRTDEAIATEAQTADLSRSAAGFPVFSSGHPTTAGDVQAILDDDVDILAEPSGL